MWKDALSGLGLRASFQVFGIVNAPWTPKLRIILIT